MAEESSPYLIGGKQSRAVFLRYDISPGLMQADTKLPGHPDCLFINWSLEQANGLHVGTGTWCGPRWFEPGGEGNLRPQLVTLPETIGAPERPHADSQSYWESWLPPKLLRPGTWIPAGAWAICLQSHRESPVEWVTEVKVVTNGTGKKQDNRLMPEK